MQVKLCPKWPSEEKAAKSAPSFPDGQRTTRKQAEKAHGKEQIEGADSSKTRPSEGLARSRKAVAKRSSRGPIRASADAGKRQYPSERPILDREDRRIAAAPTPASTQIRMAAGTIALLGNLRILRGGIRATAQE